MNADAVAVCSATIARHSKSFALASRLLAPDARGEAVVLYHWCRRADDLVDLPQGDPRAAVAQLNAELDLLYSDEIPTDITLAAMQQVVRRRAIPRTYPAELLEGMRMDTETTFYENTDELMLYCYRVAGTVGLMMSHVLGVSDDAALRHAAHLGMAMQLTNIARDVREDWDRGRLYLPLDLVRRHAGEDLRPYLGGPLPARFRAPLARVVREVLDTADGLYRSGDLGLRYLSRRSALAVRTARYVYAGIGGRIARKQFDVFAGRAYVPRLRKLYLAAGAAWITLRENRRASSRVFKRATLRSALRFPRDLPPPASMRGWR
jgi:phytoene synthase